MRCEASLCGLALAVAIEGEQEACAQLASALEPHAVSRAASPKFATDRLELELRLLPGFPPAFDKLAVSRVGTTFSVRGDGVTGEIGDDCAKLEVIGGGLVALQTAMRLACAVWLATRNGLLLHGASVERGGRGAVFLGPSGAGKSTLSRRLHAAGVRVIADEVAAVHSRSGADGSGGPRLFGHPLPRRVGDGRAPEEGFPLVAIGLLSHAPAGENATMVRLGRSQAARALLQRIFLPAVHTSLVQGALVSAEMLAGSVPVFALSLPNDDRATDAALGLFHPELRQ